MIPRWWSFARKSSSALASSMLIMDVASPRRPGGPRCYPYLPPVPCAPVPPSPVGMDGLPGVGRLLRDVGRTFRRLPARVPSLQFRRVVHAPAGSGWFGGLPYFDDGPTWPEALPGPHLHFCRGTTPGLPTATKENPNAQK
jgi:hypothetical protein